MRIAAVEDENTGNDREISENILSDYNTSFEDAPSKLVLYSERMLSEISLSFPVFSSSYEFTYYAKLTQGTDNGEVQFQVTSASKDWSSQKSASIELDKVRFSTF